MVSKRNLHFDLSSHCFSSGIQWLVMFLSEYVSQMKNLIDNRYIIWNSFFLFFFLTHLNKK